MSKDRLKGLGQNKTEKLFYNAMTEIDAKVVVNPSIRSPYPVADRYGIIKKTVTTPDYLLIFPDGRSMYVEITKGSGDLPAKEAQRRVVEAAGVKNYIQLSGDQVSVLASSKTQFDRKRLLFDFFGWD